MNDFKLSIEELMLCINLLHSDASQYEAMALEIKDEEPNEASRIRQMAKSRRDLASRMTSESRRLREIFVATVI